MKKLLALVLALVMTLGLATVAANASFPDAADVDLNEAVDVLSAVGVFQGDEKGNFQPKANLDRAAAAKLIAYLDLGEKAAEALPAVQVFSDVPANNWASKFVAYCYNAGYIAGAGDGKFLPSNALTGYAFGKMILCVLGYDAAIEGFTGATWSINVAKLMDKIDLAKGVDGVASAILTREQAAQYCLNALKANMVEYEDKGTTVSINGATIATGAKAAKDALAATGTTKYQSIDTATDGGKEIIQLGEKLYDGKLKYNSATSKDDFGRDINEWQYKDEKVADHTTEPVVTYTNQPSVDTLVKALKGYKLNGDKIVDKSTVVDTGKGTTIGALTTADGDKIIDDIRALTANGVLVEIYADDDKEIENVIAVAYNFAKVTDVTTNSKGVTTYEIGNLKARVYADKDAGDDEVEFVGAAPAKNDYVTYFAGASKAYVYPTTSFTGKMTKYTDTSMIIDGTSYDKANDAIDKGVLTAASAFNGTDEAKFYVDQFGYVVAVDGTEDTQYAAVDSAVWVTGTGVEGKDYLEARLVFTDGTTKVVTVKKVDGTTTTSAADVKKGDIYKYSISSGKYNLTSLGADGVSGSEKFEKGTPAIGANNNTIYVVKTKDGSDDVWTAYTGYKNMPTTRDAVKYFKAQDGGKVEFVYVDATLTDVGDSTSDVAMFFTTSYTTDRSDPDNELYVYEGFVNGEKKDIVSESKLTFTAGTLYKATMNDKGYVTKLDASTESKFYAVTADGTTAAKDGILTIVNADVNAKLKTTTLSYDGSEKVYFVNVEEKTIETGSIESVKDDAQIFVKTVENDDSAKGYAIKTAYVLVVED